MKKSLKPMAMLLTVLLCICMSGCDISKSSAVLLDYSTGLGDDLQYNNKLYGMNCSNDIEGADPGCFFVSKDEDPEYGGYYYMYKSGSTADEGVDLIDDFCISNNIATTAYRCYRSKDLFTWELAGAMHDGYSLVVKKDDWAEKCFWAPEVIRNSKDGKYYLYFSASAYENWGVSCMSSSKNEFDRLYLGVAVSDAPIGPFYVISDKDSATGKNMPTINFHTGCNTEYNWAAIDVSPFFGDNGDLYLYFNKHTDDHYDAMMGVWGMKMKSAFEPDYSTVSYLAAPGKETASSVPGKIDEVKKGNPYYDATESGINEAPFMLKHNNKYYLTYASNGYGQSGYSVHQAISDKPLEGFKKPSMEEGNPVLNGSAHGYMNGTAHHAIVKNGDEYWIVYHRHNSLQGVSDGWDRSICADRVNFVTNSEGTDVLSANGPSKCLQWLPCSVSGYENLAKSADITVNTGEGKEYLTDGILPFYTVTQKKVYSEKKKDVVISLKWDKPVSVSSVMLYNAYDIYSAYSEIAKIRFKLAKNENKKYEKYKYAVIKNVEFPKQYWNSETEEYIQCSPAVAEFNSLTVTSLEITINSDDRLIKEDKMGNPLTSLNLSELVVLGEASK